MEKKQNLRSAMYKSSIKKKQVFSRKQTNTNKLWDLNHQLKKNSKNMGKNKKGGKLPRR